MDTQRLTVEGLRSLHEKQDGSCISIYMQTHRFGTDTKQDPIRFKNLLKEAEGELLSQGLRASDADQLLAPLQSLENDREFWAHQKDGLALFVANDSLQCYRLPFEVSELVVVADRFHTTPLIPLFFTDQTYLVLAIGLETVRLFKGNLFSLVEIDVPGLPGGVKSTLAEFESQNDLQAHSANRGSASTQAIFHGHDPSDQYKSRIEQHFRKVNTAIAEALREEKSPMLLVGVEYLLSIYRSVNTYGNVLSDSLLRSSEQIVLSDLHREASTVVTPHLKEATAAIVEQYKQKLSTGRASPAVEKIVPAAKAGRLESLLINETDHVWGRFDIESNQVRIDQEQAVDNEDLVNLAAAECILNGGTVICVDSAELANASMGGIFRY